MSTDHICSYCGKTFSLPDDAFRFLKFGGNGSQIYRETRGRTELIHRLESAKRSALLRRRAEQQFQILKPETRVPADEKVAEIQGENEI